jgi:hypothetical protein
MPVACARSNHWCRAAVVRTVSLGVVGCRKSDRNPNIKGRITAYPGHSAFNHRRSLLDGR